VGVGGLDEMELVALDEGKVVALGEVEVGILLLLCW